MKNKFSIIISNNPRSYLYLKYLKKNNLIPEDIIYLNKNVKNFIAQKLRLKKYFFPQKKITIFNTFDINEDVYKFLKNKKVKNIVYSGYSGVVIKHNKILNEKNLIHCHPGKLPKFRGSTTIYYSILQNKKIFCSTLILNQKIDAGDILFCKEYPLPKKITNIDNKYDDEIRAKNLVYTLKNIKKLRKKENLNKKNLPYYVMHPILRSIVFKKMQKTFRN
tara:strand:- start:5275 stop:5934 length:660 start_codon:yes stop_codon:yes gene_type:complete